MSGPTDFKQGDRVAHIMLGDGVVTDADENSVSVLYARVHRVSGYKTRPIIGTYDRKWFALNPDYLFHRSV